MLMKELSLPTKELFFMKELFSLTIELFQKRALLMDDLIEELFCLKFFFLS